MAIKILIKRKFQNATTKDISTLLIMARKIAMEHPGYISSETLSSLDDPNTVVVLSMWRTKEDWENYKNSPGRQENERKFSEILASPVEYESYTLGL